jgi:hypothetical protein
VAPYLAPLVVCAAAAFTCCEDGDGPSGPDPDLVAECEDPAEAWIWCDDFEQDRLDGYFELGNPGGDGFVRTDGVGDKLSRAIVFAGDNWSEAAIAHVWSGSSWRDGTNESR